MTVRIKIPSSWEGIAEMVSRRVLQTRMGVRMMTTMRVATIAVMVLSWAVEWGSRESEKEEECLVEVSASGLERKVWKIKNRGEAGIYEKYGRVGRAQYGGGDGGLDVDDLRLVVILKHQNGMIGFR